MAKINNSAKNKFVKQGTRILKTEALPKAQQLVPVITGELKNSLQVGESSDGLPYLYTDKNYAPNVEFGTVNQEPSPFLRPAIRSIQD